LQLQGKAQLIFVTITAIKSFKINEVAAIKLSRGESHFPSCKKIFHLCKHAELGGRILKWHRTINQNVSNETDIYQRRRHVIEVN
jgi:hypothetical protein